MSRDAGSGTPPARDSKLDLGELEPHTAEEVAEAELLAKALDRGGDDGSSEAVRDVLEAAGVLRVSQGFELSADRREALWRDVVRTRLPSASRKSEKSLFARWYWLLPLPALAAMVLLLRLEWSELRRTPAGEVVPVEAIDRAAVSEPVSETSAAPELDTEGALETQSPEASKRESEPAFAAPSGEAPRAHGGAGRARALEGQSRLGSAASQSGAGLALQESSTSSIAATPGRESSDKEEVAPDRPATGSADQAAARRMPAETRPPLPVKSSAKSAPARAEKEAAPASSSDARARLASAAARFRQLMAEATIDCQATNEARAAVCTNAQLVCAERKDADPSSCAEAQRQCSRVTSEHQRVCR